MCLCTFSFISVISLDKTIICKLVNKDQNKYLELVSRAKFMVFSVEHCKFWSRYSG